MLYALIPYILASLGLAASLALFFTMKRELRVSTVKSRKRIEEIMQRLDAAYSRAPETVFLPAAPRAGLNISKRIQAVRMLRRNEDIGHISAALGVTRKEVELLIHVHRITHTRTKTAGSNEYG